MKSELFYKKYIIIAFIFLISLWGKTVIDFNTESLHEMIRLFSKLR